MNATARQTNAFQHGRAYNDNKPKIVLGAITTTRVLVHGDRSKWSEELGARFETLVKLPHGWDGYRSQPVSFACAKFAASILERIFVDGLRAPSLVPGSDGSLQIEWHKNSYDVELDVLAPNRVIAYRHDQMSGQETELEIENDFSQIVDWLNGLTVARGQLVAAG